MKNLDTDFLIEASKLTNQPIFLYTVWDYDDATNNLYFAEYRDNVVFDGITYTSFPITHEFVTENLQGKVDSIRLNVGNVSRQIQSYLEAYNWRGKKVTIRIVFANRLANADEYYDTDFYIEAYAGGDTSTEFVLTSKFDAMNTNLPRRVYHRNFCSWRFKGTECQYAGVETECNKTLQRCRELNNTLRFGGFPSVPTRRLYVR